MIKFSYSNGGGIMNMKKFLLSLIALFFISTNAGFSKDIIGLGFGFGIFNGKESVGKIKEKSYNYYNVYYEREYNLKERIKFVLEPFLSFVSHPDRGICTGISGIFRYYLKETPFFFDGGLGISYSSLKYPGQASKVLPMPLVGIGIHFNISKKREILIVDRFIHMSNASTKSPNGEVNSNLITLGITF